MNSIIVYRKLVTNQFGHWVLQYFVKSNDVEIGVKSFQMPTRIDTRELDKKAIKEAQRIYKDREVILNAA